VLFLLKLQTAD